MKKKIVAMMLTAALAVTVLAGCGAKDDANMTAGAETDTEVSENEEKNETAANFDADTDISVISREEGSGTRGAFVELFGVEQKNEAGEKIDHTTVEASVTNNTSVMMTSVANDLYAIGYISLGSLDETVKAVKIDGAEASVENIKNGTYAVSRPFNLAVKEELSDAAKDFMNYILSAQGQAVVEENGYIMADDAAPAYESNGAKGNVVVAGSSSITPVMEKLKEAYAQQNPDVQVEIQANDSTTGVTFAIEGTCDIGMASRALKDTEMAEGVKEVAIAKDGIAVIVNNENPTEELTTEIVKNIYVGDILTWSEI